MGPVPFSLFVDQGRSGRMAMRLARAADFRGDREGGNWTTMLVFDI